MKPGLCSVTFRQRSTGEIIDASVAAGLEGIEWGGDVHVPPGEEAGAATLRRRCADAGLACPSYGSYLCAGRDDDDTADRVITTAVALGAPTVRVWAGPAGSDTTRATDRRRVADDLARWADRATSAGLALATEFHAGTLTDTAASTTALLEAAGDPPVWTYWQPRDGDAGNADLDELDVIAPHLAHVHVFWWRSWLERFPLDEGGHFWGPALARAKAAPTTFPHPRWAFLEFVPGDDPDALAAEVAALRSWLA